MIYGIYRHPNEKRGMQENEPFAEGRVHLLPRQVIDMVRDVEFEVRWPAEPRRRRRGHFHAEFVLYGETFSMRYYRA